MFAFLSKLLEVVVIPVGQGLLGCLHLLPLGRQIIEILCLGLVLFPVVSSKQVLPLLIVLGGDVVQLAGENSQLRRLSL